MGYLPSYLEMEIKEKVAFLRDPARRGLCNLICQSRAKKAIRSSAQVHSFKMENPHLQVPYSIPKAKRKIKKGVKLIHGAFVWGKDNFDPDNFDDLFIREIAGRVNPDLGQPASFRTGNVRIAGAACMPPYPMKVREQEIPFLIDSLKKRFVTSENNPVEQMMAAFFAHYHLTRIHPFEDGNGRTSRTTQDVILDHYGLPLPVIEAGERGTYYAVLGQADLGWREKGSTGKVVDMSNHATSGENEFYTFMAGKINSSLDRVIDCLQ